MIADERVEQELVCCVTARRSVEGPDIVGDCAEYPRARVLVYEMLLTDRSPICWALVFRLSPGNRVPARRPSRNRGHVPATERTSLSVA
jgi:hypothetical protein